jgi:hypothetical protein
MQYHPVIPTGYVVIVLDVMMMMIMRIIREEDEDGQRAAFYSWISAIWARSSAEQAMS